MAIVITRHKALIEYLREIGLVDNRTQISTHCNDVEEIRGRTVIGPLPLHLAAEAASIVNIPLQIPQEMRGKELTLEQVREFAGEPQEYTVRLQDNYYLAAKEKENKRTELCRQHGFSEDTPTYSLIRSMIERWAEENQLIESNVWANDGVETNSTLMEQMVKLMELPKHPFEKTRDVKLIYIDGSPVAIISIRYETNMGHSGSCGYIFKK